MASTGLIRQKPRTSYGSMFAIRFTHPGPFDNHNLDYAEVIAESRQATFTGFRRN